MHLVLISASFLTVIAKYTAESADPVCGEPPDINFASLTDESSEPYSIGSTVTYGCQFGYVISGDSRNLKCVRSGRNAVWTEPEFTCLPRSCGDPGVVTNGRRVGSLFTFPNSVSYYCDEGYKMRGIATRYCQTSGTWSGRLPVCEVITCNPPKNIENGHVTASSFEYGSEIEYKCDKGFSLNTDETIYCTEEGRWSNTDVACIETICEVPEAPEFGHVYFRGTEDRPRAGSIAVFICDDGKIADGPTASKCLDTGFWTFPPPKCIEPCSIPYVPNGDIGKSIREGRYRRKVFKKKNVGERVEDYEELVIRCFKGFEVADSGIEETQITCGKGKWSPEPICNPAPCRSAIPVAANAKVMEINRMHDGTVSYKCLTDYKKRTEETVTCVNGVWLGEPPTCESTKCSVNTLTSPGLQKGWKTFYRDGEVFEVTCNQNYQLATGSSGQIMCKEGAWTGDLSPCVPVNCSDPPPSIAHGRVKNPFSMAHGSIVKYACEHPYILVGETLVQCAFGKWTGQPSQCQDSRCYLTDLKNKEHVSTRSETFTFSGDRINIVCDEGYSPKSKKMPLCLNGSWQSDYEPLCEDSGCEIPKTTRGSFKEERFGDWEWKWGSFHFERVLHFEVIQAGSTVPSGTVLWFYCDEPYSVYGNGKRRVQTRCLRGRWSTEPQCLLDGEILVPSASTSILNRWTTESELPRSIVAIRGEYLPPPTTPKAEEWVINVDTPSINIDESEPEEVVTSSTSQEPPTKECFCEYPVEDNNIVAHVDGKQLIYGDRVRNGSTVLFHCLHVGYHRFRGHREITCTGCQSWDVSDFPFCVPPKTGDAAILFNRDINVLPDGNIEIHKGQSVNFTCVAMEIAQFPDWSVPENPDILMIRERRERKDYGDVVYLTHLQIQNADYENEGTYECYIDDSHKTMLEVVITDPDLRCPELPEDERIIIRYNRERRENSEVSFTCPIKGQELIGKPILTCLRSGEWSDVPPHCSGVRCKVLTANDLLQIDYSNEREIGSYAAFHCPLPGRRSGISLTHCLEDGTWAHPTPSCRIPDCAVEDLLSSVPHNVVPVVDSMKNNSLPYNSTVRLACTDDMVAIGNPMAKCDIKGKWKIDMVQCAYGCQVPIKPPSSKLLLNPEADIYKIGEKLTLSCPPGMILNKESEVIMCMNSGWSDPVIPDCKDNYTSGDKRRT